MNLLRKHLWIALGLAAAIAIRLYCIHAHPHIIGDALIYGDLAKNMLQHHAYGFTDDGGVRSTLIRLPGYPAFMALCFAVFGVEHYNSVLYLQLVLDVFTCLLLATLATRLMGRRAGIAALWLAALCPFTADYAAAGYTETVAIFCVTVAFFSLERWFCALRRSTAWNAWLVPLALALTYACLLRPDRALLAACVVLAMILMAWRAPAQRSAGFSAVVAVCLVIAAPLTLWGLRNQRIMGVFQPLAPKYANDPGEFVSDGFNRWYRTWAIEFKNTYDVYWNYDGSTVDLATIPERAYDNAQQKAATEAAMNAYNDETSATPEIDAQFAAIADERIHANPVRYYVVLPVARVANMWLRPRTEMLDVPIDWWNFSNTDDPRGCYIAAAYAVINFAFLGLAIVGLQRWRRNWLDENPRPRLRDARHHPAALRHAAHHRQLRAALHHGLLPHHHFVRSVHLRIRAASATQNGRTRNSKLNKTLRSYLSQSHAAPRTPLESPCIAATMRVFPPPPNTSSPSRRGTFS